MTVRASWNGTVVAESDETVIVEGNHYFPPKSVNSDLLSPSETHTHCPWKGDASYYDLNVAGERNADAVWYYPEPYPAAEEIRDYVAFWHGVQVDAEEGDGRQGPIPPPR
jgi:uncharacterized protein (DUF427 family)